MQRVWCGLAFLSFASSALAADWPQWLGPKRDGVWRETGLVDKFPKGGPPVLWRVSVQPGFSGPAVASGRVFLTDFEPSRDSSGKPAPNAKGGTPGKERVLCLDAQTGKLIWKHDYDCVYKISYGSGPRTTPLIHNGHVFTLGAMSDFICLDALTGKVYWSKNLGNEYHARPPAWGWSSNPLLDGNLIYCLVGGTGSAVVAFDASSGKEVWKALTAKEIAYSSPVIIEAGRNRQLIVWHGESINSLDPATGRLYWTIPYPQSGEPHRPSVNIATPRQRGDLLFITSVFHGPMMLTLAEDKPAATVLWNIAPKDPEKNDSLSCLMSSPSIAGGYIYGVCFGGELRCIDAASGKQQWQTYAATGGKQTDCGTAFLVPQGNRFVIFNDQGDLILADLSPKGYREIDRAHLLEPLPSARGRNVVWSHPAFAERCVFARNDKELICVSLADRSLSGELAAHSKRPLQRL
jgi:outer membrane protein assembly factor BamB